MKIKGRNWGENYVHIRNRHRFMGVSGITIYHSLHTTGET